METPEPERPHRISVVCVDYFAPAREWVAICWCGSYKSSKLPSSELAAERAGAHLRAKGAWPGTPTPDDGRVKCSVCGRRLRITKDGSVGWHGDKIHFPVRACEGAWKPPA